MKTMSRVKRWMMLAIVLFVGTAFSASTSYFAEEGSRKLQINDLSASVDRWTTIWEFSTNKEIMSFRSLIALFKTVPEVSQTTFFQFTKNTLTYYPDLKQVFWVPKISLEQRASVDSFLRQQKPISFIKEFSGSEGFFPAAVRNTYYPILFNDGGQSSNAYRGWELGVFPAFSGVLNAIDEAKENDVVMRFLPALDDVIKKNQKPHFEMFLMKRVIKETVVPLKELSISSDGFLGVLVDFSKIFSYFGDIPNIDKVQIHISVINDNGQNIDIFKVSPASGALLPEYEIKRKFNAQAAQDWSISVIPTDAYFNSKSGFNNNYLLVGGMITTLILLSYIYSIQQRAIVVEKVVIKRTNELQQANIELDRLSHTDHLTGLFNRRYFEEALDREWRRAIRENTSLSMVMIDIDYFKQYNDHYGHIEGDFCLQQVAKQLKESVSRPADVVARFGGEEFVILLPNTGESAKVVAERCRLKVEKMCMPHAKSEVSPFVTISVGVATVFPVANQPPRILTKYADSALYKAKENGRNCVFSNHDVCEPLFV